MLLLLLLLLLLVARTDRTPPMRVAATRGLLRAVRGVCGVLGSSLGQLLWSMLGTEEALLLLLLLLLAMTESSAPERVAATRTAAISDVLGTSLGQLL
jgi:hypothetical protein